MGENNYTLFTELRTQSLLLFSHQISPLERWCCFFLKKITCRSTQLAHENSSNNRKVSWPVTGEMQSMVIIQATQAQPLPSLWIQISRSCLLRKDRVRFSSCSEKCLLCASKSFSRIAMQSKSKAGVSSSMPVWEKAGNDQKITLKCLPAHKKGFSEKKAQLASIFYMASIYPIALSENTGDIPSPPRMLCPYIALILFYVACAALISHELYHSEFLSSSLHRPFLTWNFPDVLDRDIWPCWLGLMGTVVPNIWKASGRGRLQYALQRSVSKQCPFQHLHCFTYSSSKNLT